MLITSIIQDAFQEYEGYLSLVLFSFGCNLRCKRCYNLEDILNKNKIIGEAIPLLKENLTPLHDAVVFLGGEPTIWKNKLIETAKYVKYERELKTKLYTNGLLPDVIENLLKEDLIDAFSVDYKVIENTDILGVSIELDEYIKKVEKTIDMILMYKKDIEIRTTKWEGVNWQKLKKYMSQRYPNIKHILTEDFLKNFE